MRLEQTIAESAAELQQATERHLKLLDAAVSQDKGDITLEVCVNVLCPCRRLLHATLLETVQVLDETRRTFKSRQLAELRYKLMRVLAEQA
ncbi:MAG: hypothetical protein GWP08_06660 [Nitrospiraceae bacterium]|nr:hypothetical protein [Nitrospiraceae bacterium]